jgi:CubicO group peptidase (beta-lactamase class C family)
MLSEFRKAIENMNIPVYSIVVLKDGEKVAEHHFMPEKRRELYSVTKSFTSTAVGIAITEGYFSLNDSILKFFEEDIPQNASQSHLDNLNKITVEWG